MWSELTRFMWSYFF